ncbi:MAG: GatB/YqeY domain-containing protein [Bacilli bacterium]
MTLLETIKNDTVTAMKEQNKFKISVLRMLKSTLQMEAINLKHELSDEEVQAVVKKQVKVRKDSIDEYAKYGKQDLVESLTKEVEILNMYLPEELTIEQINAGLDKIFAELQPTSIKDMGIVMKEASKLFGVQADMKVVSNLIRERLN